MATGGRQKLLYLVAVILLVSGLVAPIVLGFQPMISGSTYISITVSRYYGAADASLLLWIDAGRTSSIESSPIGGELLEAARITGARAVLAVEPDCTPAQCPGAWGVVRELVLGYGWELAVKAPADGVWDAVSTAEEALGGYRVVTRALPSPIDAIGVGILPVELLPLPGLPSEPDPDGMRLHYTVRVDEGVAWRQWLDASIREAIVVQGIVVVYVDAWNIGDGLAEVLGEILDLAGGYRVWIATARDIYLYSAAAQGSSVIPAIGEGALKVAIDGPSTTPITLVIDPMPRLAGPPRVDGGDLPPTSGEATVGLVEGYMIEDNRLIVNVRPPARLELPLDGGEPVLVPSGLVKAYRGIETARLLVFAVWAPILANLGLAAVGALRRRTRRTAIGAEYAVIIPARNAAGTIGEVLLSALRQTVKPSLVVVLDDASTDGTGEVVSRLAARLGLKPGPGPRIDGASTVEYRGQARILVVRFRGHTGKAGMVNRVLPALPGGIRYILILDSDTILERRYVEKVLESMGAYAADAANGILLLWKPDRRGRLAWGIAGALRNLGSTIVMLGLRSVETSAGGVGSLTGSAMIVSRRALERVGGLPEETLAEDAELTWRLALEGYRSIIVPEAMAYTVDPGSLQGVFRKSLRIYKGLLASTARLLPEALSRLKLKLAATMVYNSLGGLPVTLSLIHLAVTLLIIALGLGEESLAYRLALALPYTPVTPLLLAAIENPLLYLATIYTLLLLEAVTLAVALAVLHRRKPLIHTTLSSIKYAPLFPLVLWINAAAMALAIPITLKQIIGNGGVKNKW